MFVIELVNYCITLKLLLYLFSYIFFSIDFYPSNYYLKVICLRSYLCTIFTLPFYFPKTVNKTYFCVLFLHFCFATKEKNEFFNQSVKINMEMNTNIKKYRHKLKQTC